MKRRIRNIIERTAMAILAFVTVTSGGAAFGAEPDYFIKIGGIDGESDTASQEGHEKWINILSFGGGMHATADPHVKWIDVLSIGDDDGATADKDHKQWINILSFGRDIPQSADGHEEWIDDRTAPIDFDPSTPKRVCLSFIRKRQIILSCAVTSCRPRPRPLR